MQLCNYPRRSMELHMFMIYAHMSPGFSYFFHGSFRRSRGSYFVVVGENLFTKCIPSSQWFPSWVCIIKTHELTKYANSNYLRDSDSGGGSVIKKCNFFFKASQITPIQVVRSSTAEFENHCKMSLLWVSW